MGLANVSLPGSSLPTSSGWGGEKQQPVRDGQRPSRKLSRISQFRVFRFLEHDTV